MNDDIDYELGLAASAVIAAAILGWILIVAAFDRQAAAQERIAFELEAQGFAKRNPDCLKFHKDVSDKEGQFVCVH